MQPWTKIGTTTVLAKKYGKWLASQNYENPITGAEEEYILFGQKDWSVVLAITSNLQVLAVRQFKQGCNKITLELPAGTVDFTGDGNEDPLAVMHDELLAETGYKAGEVTSLGSYWIATRNSPTRFHCFLATGCVVAQQPKQDPSEIITRVSMPLQEWIDQSILRGEIDEPSAVVTTARSIPHLLAMGYKIQLTQ